MEEPNQSTLVAGEVPGPAGLSPLQIDAVIYGVITFLLACFVVFMNRSPAVRDAGVFTKLLAVVVGAGLGTIGAMIGDALRKAVHPDAVYTTGGFWSLLWTKVFWKWGPQTIGLLIGLFVGVAMVVK